MAKLIKHVEVIPNLLRQCKIKLPSLHLENFEIRKVGTEYKHILHTSGRDTEDNYLIFDPLNNDPENSIGYITYVKNTGQIGLMGLKPEYRGRNLGRQILERIIKESEQKYNNGCFFAVTIQDHPFWKRLPGAEWREPVHPSITGSGYYFDIHDFKFEFE